MDVAAIATMEALRCAIASLPPVTSGCQRVWRGQGQDHAQMLPSGLRRPVPKRAIWIAYAQHLHLDMVPELLGPDGSVDMRFIQAAGLWLDAVAQHYGPGSAFLDVSHEIGAALWFALNHYSEVREDDVIGPPGPPDPLLDHPMTRVAATYEPFDGAASLYAFDLPTWDGQGLPEAGTIIDLAHAPAVFADSPRMRAQAGCLVYCRRADGSALDLRPLRVPGTPLSVQRPLTGATGIDRRVPQMFPSPALDIWYARLLSVPMNYTPEPAPPRLQRTLPVVPYFDREDADYTAAVAWRDVALSYPLLHRRFPDFCASADPARRPVPIILEAPLVFPYPTGDSGEWHHGLLAEDLPARCTYFEPGVAEPAGEVALDSVLFEFSALEFTGWERVAEQRVLIERALRGLWLRRQPDHWLVHFLHQTLPNGELETDLSTRLRFDAERRRWVFFKPGDANRIVPIRDLPGWAKAVLLALMLLRHLNPTLKFNALMKSSARLEDGPRHAVITGSRAAARLLRVASPVCDWYVLRDNHAPQEPYTHDSHPDGQIELRVVGEFADVPLELLRMPAGS